MRRINSWSKSEERKLRLLWPDHTRQEIALVIHRTCDAIKTRGDRLGLKKLKGHRRFTNAERQIMRAIYPDTPSKDIAKQLNRPVDSIYELAHLLGLRKSAAYMASPAACRLRRGDNPGIPFRFKPGLVPWNKGLRHPGYSLTHGRMAETTFKKGQKSRNYLPIGTIREDADGYLRQKISDGLGGFGCAKVWQLLHLRTWKKAHHRRKVPRGHVIVFKDGNKKNVASKNLECITRAELMRRNSIHTRMPPELRRVILLTEALKRQIRERREKQRGKQTQYVSPAGPSVRHA